MTTSIWRFSHLSLAVSSFLFLALASITGTILAFEPILQKAQPFKVGGFEAKSLADVLPLFKNTFGEINEIKVDDNNFVIVYAINNSGDNIEVYVDPKTGQKLGTVAKQSAFFKWITSLHRSLFLHETGRLLVGIASFLLFLSAISGTILIIRRQRGIRNFFAKIIKKNFAQYYHVVTGRLSLIPILIIALSGTFLSLEKIDIIKEEKISHQINFDSIKSEPIKKLADFSIFRSTKLSEIQSIEFPFSNDPEDYFTLKTDDRELVINQFTGEVLSEIKFSRTSQISAMSMLLHTGRASGIWALILAIASANILFFIYSGFAITLKRISNRSKNKFSASESKYIILVGSENGSSFRYANAINKYLIEKGEKSSYWEMNDYKIFPKAEHFLIFTATYGLGDAPVNANKFLHLLNKYPQQQNCTFSVVGFGSRSYPEFCKFAFEVNNAISQQKWAIALTEIQTVNDKSPSDFSQWATLWSQKIEMAIPDLTELFSEKPKKLNEFLIVEKTEITHDNGAFLIRLKPKNKIKFTSGDLLSNFPANDHRERQYSIGKIDNEVQLSVKLHPNGFGSEYLFRKKIGDSINAAITENKNFYFPRKSTSVIMISNGTGIAPFLGMIDQNDSKTKITLYAGFRGKSSSDLYQSSLNQNLQQHKLFKVNLAFSREGAMQYVKDLLEIDSDFIAKTLLQDGVIMICGSLSMQQNVIELLEKICQENHLKSLSFYQSRKQVLMDCY